MKLWKEVIEMLFNSFEFLFIFLPITFIVYFLLNKLKLIKVATAWLVLASLVFYSYWKIDYLPLILISMIFNYSIGSTLSHETKLKINRKLIMIFAIIANVGLLAYYKYFDFLIKNINMILHQNFNYMHIVLPLAISFFTFQQIAYIVDSYENKTKEYDFLTYALFITFFPQLIAGPIVHHKEMMPQFANLKNRLINHKNISIGLFLLGVGLFKKVIIADNLSPFVINVFDYIPVLSCLEAWCASISYTFQLYFDFSGYCDMALGIGYLFNIILPQNFNSPYIAENIQDFWRRWHMTLSRFLRDYIYIPLGGNRNGKFKTYRNLFLTFLIGGLWHGANWTFVVWGALHGTGMCIHRFWKTLNIKIPHIISMLLTFLFVNFAFVYFRALTLTKANSIILSMFGKNGFAPISIDKMRLVFENGDLKISLLLLIGGFILIFFFKNSVELAKQFKNNWIYFAATTILLLVSILSMNKVSEFLYFQF